MRPDLLHTGSNPVPATDRPLPVCGFSMLLTQTAYLFVFIFDDGLLRVDPPGHHHDPELKQEAEIHGVIVIRPAIALTGGERLARISPR